MPQTLENTLHHAAPHGWQLHASPQAARLRWLVHLRWIYAALMLVMAGTVELTMRASAPAEALLLGGIVLIVLNGVAWLDLRRCLRTAEAERLLSRTGAGEILVDLIVLLLAVGVTGGAASPLAAAVAFHLAVSASLLRAPVAYSYAAAAAVGYAGLGFWQATGSEFLFGASLAQYPLVSSESQRLVLAGALAAMVSAAFVGSVYFTNAVLGRLRRINERLTEANRQLSAMGLVKSRFLRLSSHQLRGPLSAIHTLVSAVPVTGSLNEKQQSLLLKVQRRLVDAMSQVDEMLLLSTIHESAAETHPGACVDAAAALRQAVESCAAEAAQRWLTVSVHADSPAAVQAWDDAMSTVLDNLLSNAMKYTPSGGSVTASVRTDGSRVVIEVGDTGIGIPPREKDRVFSEFFRATNARQVAGGTGLGLAIVKATMDRLGGQVEVHSELNKGTTVRLTLPAARVPVGQQSLGPAADSASSVQTDAAKDQFSALAAMLMF